MEAWYAVNVKRHRERSVAEHLTTKSVTAFLPLIEICRRYARRRVTLLEPLFPGYLFVHLTPTDAGTYSWNTIRWAPGVRAILGTGGVPVPVPEDAIAAIQAKTSELGFVRPALPFLQGSRVRIRGGPLAGLDAIFECQVSSAGRVRILLELLRQLTRVEIDTLDLEPV